MRYGLSTGALVVVILTACGGGGAGPAKTTSVASQSSASNQVKISLGMFAFGPDGRLYASDCDSGMVVAVDSIQTGHVVAGGEGGAGGATLGDGGPAVKADLLCPSGLAFDHTGRLLIADHGHNRIRRVEHDGTIATIAGVKSPPVLNNGTFSGDGGPAVDATFDVPNGLTMDAKGDLFIGDRENQRVRKIAPDGIITTLAGDGDTDFGGDGGPATKASLYWPLNTAVDAAGNVYIADDNHNRVRKVTADGTITTVIGDGTAASTGDGGPASKAEVNDPEGVAVDAAGNLYVSEFGGNSDPPGGNRIRRITPDGVVMTVAGTGRDGLSGIPGPATNADIPQPGMLAIGPDGALYVQDQNYGRILRIDLATGQATVSAGTPTGIVVTLPNQ
jgi:sugar lactone lactonase YvrE